MSGPNETPSQPAPPRPSRRERLAALDLGRRALQLVLILGIGAAGGVLVSPGAAHRLPGPESLGQPAARTIKADRDYDLPDAEATDRRRAEAAAGERPVYDQDDGAPEEATARIHAAFTLMRAEIGTDPLAHLEKQHRTPALRDAFVSQLQVVVREDDFAALAAQRFSEGLEADLAGVAARGLTGIIVADRKLLPADRNLGFVVRSFRGGDLQGERIVTGAAPVREEEEARAEVSRAAAERLAERPPALRSAVARLATAMIRPTLVQSQAETERRRREAAARVKPVGIPIKRGERIIGDGERIERRHLVIFDGIRAQTRNEDLAAVRLGGGALVALFAVALWIYARRNIPRLHATRKDAVLLAFLFTGTLALGWIGLEVADALHDRFPVFVRPSLYHLVPFAAGAMIVRQVLSAEAALLFAVAAGLSAGLLAGQSLAFGVFATFTGIVAAGRVGGTHDRAGLFRAGALVGVAGALLATAALLHAGRGASEIVVSAAGAFVGGTVLLPIVVIGVLPLVEGAFGYATDVKLLELANLNHPALKELIVQAPGTYHHSILMGSMVEAAAQAIGANPLLAKVSAYYHDLGKTRNPGYFAENQRGENRHDALAPSMSALIIKRHVTDGLELARHWKLPRVVQDAIVQHHGTRHVGYFWAKCQHEPAQGAHVAATDEALYRYPGPKPRSREAALVMIADGCEASARALPEQTAEALRALVTKRINEVFAEGQLDDCELTLRDLNAIATAMAASLEAIYHSRPEYPHGRAQPEAPAVQLVARP